MFDGPTRHIPLLIDGNSITGFCLLGPDERMHPCVFDTGAEFSIVPQKFWSQQFDRHDVEQTIRQRINLRTGFGHVCPARKYPTQLMVTGIDKESQAPTTDVIDFGECEIRFAFDEDKADSVAAQYQVDLMEWRAAVAAGSKISEPKQPAFETLNVVYIGLGGGTFRNGGLCINWAKPEAVLVEQTG